MSPSMAANIESILQKVKRYVAPADSALLRRAHDYATAKHEGQFRKTGEPYIKHPIEVVDILAGLEMDAPSLCAGFLHDVIEDCGVSRDELAEEFGDEIADLVDGVTKLKLTDFERRVGELPNAVSPKDVADKAKDLPPDPRKKKRLETRSSAENLRKILLAMARDFRVMVIKLSDRLHNMRTLTGLSPERQKKVAEETMQIFAPLAHRLGIWQVKWQLEDLAFKYIYPEEYEDIAEKVSRTRRDREKDIRDAVYKLRDGFDTVGMKPEIQGRPKHLWSIYNKVKKNELEVGDLYDLIALRVVVDTVQECYAALGVVHELYLPIPGKFDDYIAKIKPNLYQSLHTKVYGPHGEPLEVQIRTWEMHRIAEFGVAAHWAYKEKGEGAKNAGGKYDFDRKMAFLRQQLFDWQQDAKDSSEFLRGVVSDLFTDQVFVFTPKGDVLDLPTGATPVDFAYRVHSSIGEHAAAAKVNGKIVPLSYKLQNGDICVIVTRPQANPSLDWLLFAKSSHARSKIKSHFRKLRYGENVIKGRELLASEMAHQNLPVEILRDHKKMAVHAQAMNKESVDDLFASVGFGDTPTGVVITRLKNEISVERDEGEIKLGRKFGGGGKLAIAPGGVDGVAINRAKCCKPLPGDHLVGYVSRGKGMVLHRDGCANVTNWRVKEPERIVDVDWGAGENAKFDTGILLESVDRVGLLRDVTEIFSENRTFIVGIHTSSDKGAGTARMRIDFESSSVEHVQGLIRKVQNLQDMIAVYRLGVGAEERSEPSPSP
ncbi:MAG: bifunctional (p)ppGpp synthetase/guanosine-3',5'-bis(diphosphate) 3'-pyrophosphohydrolase [Akkermansiaceae bacterium]|nr:bifunctional (p)ppGpp synthetase/guanosine-3',5'-bis(diphosphate) 3'-pyrophosphohydrolase [Armatimonadota bacterium]